MNKDDLIKGIVDATGIKEEDANKALIAVADVIKEAYDKNEKLYLRGFGTFFPKHRNARIARDFFKNSSCVVPERRIIAFKATPKFYTRGKADD